MPRSLPALQRWLAWTILVILAGCTPMPADDTTVQADSPDPAALMEAARDAPSETERVHLLLQAVSAYQERGEHETARQLLAKLETEGGLDDANRDQWLLLAMHGAAETGNRRWARRLVGYLDIDQFQHYPDAALRQRAAALQLEIYELAGRPLAIARTLVLAAPLFETEERAEQRNRIWRSLMSAPLEDVQALARTATDFTLQGWLELALSLRGARLSLEDQSDLIRQWQDRWPTHPAAVRLPEELELLASLPEQRPDKLLVALPLSGPLEDAGKAIREGFLAAYYADQGTTARATVVEIVDTHEREFSAIYAELPGSDTDLVIGPLRKESVATVAQAPRLPVPVLALNYIEGEVAGAPPENLYQFGLSPEDEARQIAARLIAEGRPNVLLFVPDSSWGQRMADAFRDALEARGGRVLDKRAYTREDSLREVVSAAFGIGQSRSRAIRVEETIGLDVEFEPRRRQDVDAIVLLAAPAMARQFKPMFAFYYGGELPVYSSSVIYDGTPEASRDADLEGVYFTDIPWILAEPMVPLRGSLRQIFPALASQYDRLFALGIDAYHLSSRLPLLDRVPGASIAGYTGRLTMTPTGQIHREQAWAVFRQGVPQRRGAVEEVRQPETLR